MFLALDPRRFDLGILADFISLDSWTLIVLLAFTFSSLMDVVFVLRLDNMDPISDGPFISGRGVGRAERADF